jgi:hypothetical protein
MVTVNGRSKLNRLDPRERQFWLPQPSLIYGGLIVIGLYLCLEQDRVLERQREPAPREGDGPVGSGS